jgi:hypothetical protein
MRTGVAMAEVGFGFHQLFAEQQAAFRLRLGNLLPTGAWDDLRHNQHDRAFVVAGALKADLLADLAAAVDKAISQGTSLEVFRKDFRQIVARHGWTGWTGEGSAKGEAWRTRVIYQTNLLTSYAAGRRAQLLAGNYKYWVYRHSGAEHPRLHHLALDGIALPPDHPFWAKFFPPNGWGCGCRVFGAHTEAGIRRVGGDPGKQLPPDWDRPDPRTGLPKGLQKGWDYAPGASTAETILTLKDKLPRLPAPIGARLFESWPAGKGKELDRAFGAFVDQALGQFVQGRHMVIGALKPGWVDAAIRHGVTPETAEIVVTDLNVQHTFRGTDHVTVTSTRAVPRQPKAAPLDLDWYKGMPGRLAHPRAVLLDHVSGEPVFSLIYDVPGRTAKMVVEINTWVKKAKAAFNTMQTGRMVELVDLRADVTRGAILVEGRL